MPTKPATVDRFLAEIADAGDVSARPMFGEYGVYCDGKMCALVCDDTVFIKATPEGRDFAGAIAEAPPYPGAKPALKPSPAQLKDAAWLSELVAITARALPAPKKKKAATKTSKGSGGSH
ncbi:MAG: TfoX/Sxy family protein [Hyphomonadaceae bacterium]|nr:TfoX/Sxy family protein [Hyphomonadaceae bacterium]